MAERFEVAAARHYNTAIALEASGAIDDAAYHYGVCGENAIKHAVQASGLEAFWLRAGVRLHNTPMRGHFPNLTALAANAQQEIVLNATGRLSSGLIALVSDATFIHRFSGWSIDIRYADDGCTPVDPADCSRWKADAEALIAIHLG